MVPVVGKWAWFGGALRGEVQGASAELSRVMMRWFGGEPVRGLVNQVNWLQRDLREQPK